MAVTDQLYLNWQSKLKTDKRFKRLWALAGIYVTGFFYFGIAFLFFARWREMALLAFIAFIVARFVICEIVYFFYKRRRPYQRLGFEPPVSPYFLSFIEKRFNSMPSGHASSLVAISAICFMYLPLLGILGFIAAIFNSWARIILGYHHISDILAGWVVGLISAWIVWNWVLSLLFTPPF